MKNSFVWFLSLVIVLSIGTYFLFSNGDSVLDFGSINEQKDENKNTISKKSKPGENSNKNNNTNKIGDISGSEMDGEQRIKLQVTMAQVSPDGSSVFGGVGPVGQTVLLFDGDTIIAEAIINDKGDWVAIPEFVFEAGSHFIQLAIKPSSDKLETERLSVTVATEQSNENNLNLENNENLPLTPNSSSASVAKKQLDTKVADLAVVIDIEDNKKEKPLVVFVPKSDSSIPVVVQSPEKFSKDEKIDKSDEKLVEERLRSVASVLDTADEISNREIEPEFIQIRSLSWEGKSKLRLSGFASGGRSMQAYFDQKYIASIKLNETESDNKIYRWSMLADASMRPNKNYTLIAKLIDKNGNTINVSQIDVSMETLSIGDDGSNMMVIYKGDALWRIAYRAYGKGVRYVDIFKRNNARISDPNLIFPNQIFAIPE